MIKIRRSADRGHRDHGWLDTRHTFSFADYHDPAHVHFGRLRVINEDWIGPGAGFGSHPHADMEILSYVVSGAMEHKDSEGNGTVIRPGEIQRMSAGTGIVYSEYNHSKTAPLHLLQIWILPEARGLKPGYDQKRFDQYRQPNSFCLLAARAGGESAVGLNQDVDLYEGSLDKGGELSQAVAEGREIWLQIVAGNIDINGEVLQAGDGCGIRHETELKFTGLTDSTFLMFDMGR
ncbi:MAG: pirin family protein [Acidobacteria bacterium]|uniref:Pirin family protein n=1 Tax=Candidatus Polarisedimenticola svalbardensis TaxID=2886004 RepID=A0A8J6XZ34_9BACT|nr:pirin family protein [Candidatus Polarisedimenticola svalbardensis]